MEFQWPGSYRQLCGAIKSPVVRWPLDIELQYRFALAAWSASRSSTRRHAVARMSRTKVRERLIAQA